MALNLQQKNEMFGAYKNEIYLMKTCMNVFAEMKANEEKEIYEKFLVRKFYHKNEKEREISETLLWIFTYSYNTTITFLNIIPCYLQQMCRIKVFYQNQSILSKTKLFVPIVSPYTLFSVFYFELNILAALC